MNKLFELLDMRNDQATSESIHTSLTNGVKLKGSPLVILFCAIIIASVGLNTNSTAVIIGAMLISPLMNPLLAIGYSISTYDGKLFRSALVIFLALFSIALVSSFVYFNLTPITGNTSEILARTEPSIFDFIIAFTGGLAGIVGVSRAEKSNVIPGVAIATALMPPLCTVGFGLASGQPDIAEGAFYLFSINVFFIIFSTFLVCKAMKLKPIYHDTRKYDILIKRSFIIISVILFIPLAITSFKIGKETYEKEQITSQLNEYIIENQILSNNTKVLFMTYSKSKNTLRLDCIGEDLTDKELDLMREYMDIAGIGDAELVVINDLERTLVDYIEMNSSVNAPKVQIVE